MGVPNGPADTATFGLSHTTDVSISANTEVNGITFTSAATNPYTIRASPDVTLTISGTGIINNSGIAQNFVTNGGQFGQISFTNNASAGNFTIFTNNHGVNNFEGGHTYFFNTSSAGNATFINKNGAVNGVFQGFTEFFDSSTAGNGIFINNGSTIINEGDGGGTGFLDTSSAGEATITNNGGTVNNAGGGSTFFADSATAASASFTNNAGMVSGAFGGGTGFIGNATAANGVFINNGGTVSGARGGQTAFSGNSTAGNSTLIANSGINGGLGGTILFIGNSTGGTARVEAFGNGSLDISNHFLSPLGVTVGSIEGDGNVFLGANNLKVGSNNLSTIFSGVIQDGGSGGGGGGSLTKIGTGTLILAGTNTYTGNTNVRDGVLQVDRSITSNTFVNSSSRLAGTGTVYGNVTNNRGGKVSPGEALGVPGMLTVVHNYTQAQYATLMIQIAGTNTGDFSVLNVLGAANLNGNLAPVLLNGFVPTIGDSLTFLNYASFTGVFSQIQNQVFNHGTEQWSVIYQNTNAILTVESHTPIPDAGSTFLLLTLGLLGLVTYRRQLLRGQP
jgi:autotransporter-associated beta strand protein